MKLFTKKADLPLKGFSDFSMSSDGKNITVVCGLSKFATPDQYLHQYSISSSPFAYLYSGVVNGQLDRKNYLAGLAEDLNSEVCAGSWFSDGSVYCSWDYGETWFVNTELKPRNWVSCDMSADGRIQVIVGRGIYKDFFDIDVIENTPTHAYISYDYGRSWEPKCSSRTWNSIHISRNGNYLIGSDTYFEEDPFDENLTFPDRPFFKNNILYSDNSGHGWDIGYDANPSNYYLNTDSGRYSELNFLNEGGVVGTAFNNFNYIGRQQCAMSSDGKYQLLASFQGVFVSDGSGFCSSVKANPSDIYGNIIYQELPNSNGVLTGVLRNKLLPLCTAMSANGQYQIVGGQGYIGKNGSDIIANDNQFEKKYVEFSSAVYRSEFNPDVYFSKDLGSTWEHFPFLRSGMCCLSIDISDDFKYIDILAVPNTAKQTSRFADTYRHADIFNYEKQIPIESDLIYISSLDSGVTWQQRDLPTSYCKPTGVMRQPRSCFANQQALGSRIYENLGSANQWNFDDAYGKYEFYNYPELEYINTNFNFLNSVSNSKIKSSADGLRAAVLHNGELLLSNTFPVGQPLNIPVKNEMTFPPSSFSNWDLVRDDQRFIVDAAIDSDGSHMVYAVNYGDIYNYQSKPNAQIYNLVEYSGHLNGYSHDISKTSVDKIGSYAKNLIFTSQSNGSSWLTFTTDEISGEFDHRADRYGHIYPTASGYFRNNISTVCISDNGRYLVALCDSIFPSGTDIISTPDADLDLHKTKFFTPYYYSSNYGSSWSTRYLEVTSKGLKPSFLHISNDGNTIYFLGQNSGTAIFEDIRSDLKLSRPDLQFIKNTKITPFAKDFYKKQISYEIPKVSLPGRALYYTSNNGTTWSKLSFIESCYYSGEQPGEYRLNSNITSAINSKVPTTEQISTSVPLKDALSCSFNSFCPSTWTTSSPFKSTFSVISAQGLLPEIIITGNRGTVEKYINPYGQGYIKWNHSSNSFEYFYHLTEDAGQKSQEFYGQDIQGSMNFINLRVARNDSQEMVALCRINSSDTDSKLLGNLLTNATNADLRSVYISHNQGSSWSRVSPVMPISNLNQSSDGRCIGYLSHTIPGPVLLDEGTRYGVPYFSNDWGSNFYPVLKWEGDIENRRCAYVSNEFASPENLIYSETSFVSGFSTNQVLENSYNVHGCVVPVASGFLDYGVFYETGSYFETAIDIARENQNVDIETDCRNFRIKSSPFYFSNAHLNTSLRCLRMSSNGNCGMIAQNDSLTGYFDIIPGNTKEKALARTIDGSERLLNSKIYYNNISGFYEPPARSYIVGAGVNCSTSISQSLPNVMLGPDSQYVCPELPLPLYNTASQRRGSIYLGDNRNYYFRSGEYNIRLFHIKSNQALFGITGEKFFKAGSTRLISNESEHSVLYSGKNLYTVDDSLDSFLTLYPSSFDFSVGKGLPLGLAMEETTLSLISGIPTQTGVFPIQINQYYNLGSSYKITSNMQIIITTGELYDYNVVGLYSSFTSGGKLLIDAIIDSGNFYSTVFNGYYSNDLLGMRGYGPQVTNATDGLIGTGVINNPTGLFKLISYETGTLTGYVASGNESYTWENFSVIGVGRPGHVYYDYINGETQSYNYAIVDESKLTNNDTITINDITFTYKVNQSEADQNVFWFNTANELMLYAAPVALVTGYCDGTRLHMYSIPDGDEMNWFTLRRDCQDLSAVIIPNIYFTGGSYLRPLATNWSGDFFSGNFDELTVINSGFYTVTGRIFGNDFLSGSGVVWDADINKTVTIETGIYTQSGYDSDFTGWYNLPYYSSANIFSGSGLLPSGQEPYYTGIGFRINRTHYNPSDTGLAFYHVTGKDIDYSGYIGL